MLTVLFYSSIEKFKRDLLLMPSRSTVLLIIMLLMIFGFTVVTPARPRISMLHPEAAPPIQPGRSILTRVDEPAEENRSEELNTLIQDWVAEKASGDFAVDVRQIGADDPVTASFNAHTPFVSASTYKLFVAYAVLEKIQEGEISLTTKTSLGRTVESCLESLIIYSWDICGYPLGVLAGGWPEHDKKLEREGYTSTILNNYEEGGDSWAFNGDKYSTAHDEALFMERLAAGQLLDPAQTDYLIDLLKRQVWRERIPAGVPDGVEVADKPGWIYTFENDAAIVYGDSTTYVLVVLTKDSSKADIAELSRVIYEFFEIVK